MRPRLPLNAKAYLLVLDWFIKEGSAHTYEVTKRRFLRTVRHNRIRRELNKPRF